MIIKLYYSKAYCLLDFIVFILQFLKIAGLHWKSNHETEIVWALEVGEFAVWNFFDRYLVNFEPHSKNLRKDIF